MKKKLVLLKKKVLKYIEFVKFPSKLHRLDSCMIFSHATIIYSIAYHKSIKIDRRGSQNGYRRHGKNGLGTNEAARKYGIPSRTGDSLSKYLAKITPIPTLPMRRSNRRKQLAQILTMPQIIEKQPLKARKVGTKRTLKAKKNRQCKPNDLTQKKNATKIGWRWSIFELIRLRPIREWLLRGLLRKLSPNEENSGLD